MKRLFAAAGLALALHLFLFTAKLPIPKYSADEINALKVISVRIIQSELQESGTKGLSGVAVKNDTHLISSKESVVAEQKVEKNEIKPLAKTASKEKWERKKSRAHLKAGKRKMEPEKESIPPPPLASVAAPDIDGYKDTPRYEESGMDVSLEEGDSEVTPQLLTHAQNPQAHLRSEEHVVEARPDYLLNPTPPYPALARKRGYDGKVIIEVLVDEKGFPSEIKIAESSGHAILDNAAAEAVDTWKFEPARRGNVPFPMRVKVPILFKLD